MANLLKQLSSSAGGLPITDARAATVWEEGLIMRCRVWSGSCKAQPASQERGQNRSIIRIMMSHLLKMKNAP